MLPQFYGFVISGELTQLVVNTSLIKYVMHTIDAPEMSLQIDGEEGVFEVVTDEKFLEIFRPPIEVINNFREEDMEELQCCCSKEI